MSQLLDEIKKIQEATNCSLAEAKDAYDKASCDVDLAIELVKESQTKQVQQAQETPKEETKNVNQFQYFVKPKTEEKEKPEKTNKIYDIISKDETVEEIEARNKKIYRFLKAVYVLCVILGAIMFLFYFLVSKDSTYKYMGITLIVLAILYLILISIIKNKNNKLLNLIKKYPNVKTSQVKTIYIKYKGKDFDAMERELRILSGESGEGQKQELEQENITTAKEFARKTNRNNKVGPIAFVLIIVIGLAIALPIIGNIYGTDFGMGEVFSSCSIGNQGGSPRKAYKLVKEDIQNQGNFLGIDNIKFNSAQYVVINDTKPAKAGAADTGDFMSGEDYTVILKVSYSYNDGGTINRTEYWGYNPKTNSIKEFPSYYGSSDFSLAQSQVQGGYYKGKTGSL